MHEEIIRFPLEGVIPDGNIVERRERLVTALECQMRDHGCTRLLDVEPQFTLDYVPEREEYNFSLTMYGIYVGDEAWNVAGVMNGKTIMRSTPKVKFMESSNTAE